MPLDPDIPFRALAGLQRVQPYDPIAVQTDIDRQQVYQAQAQKAQQEMQAQAKLQQLAQQYGNDPDELVKQLGSVDPMLAQKLGEQIGQARYAGAQAHLEQSKAGEAEMDSWIRLLQGTDEKTWGPVLGAAVNKLPQLKGVISEDYAQGKQQALALSMSGKDWAKTQAEASQLYLDDKKQESAARLIAGADTPQKRQIADGLLKQAGLGQFSQMWASPQEAQAFLAQSQKPEDDKVQGAEIEAIKAFRDAHGRKPTEAELDQIHRRFKEAGTIVRVTGGGAGSSGSVAGLTTGEGGGLELAGTMARLLGRVPIGLSRGGAGPAVMNEAARQNKLVGQTPVAMMQKAAMYQADSKALANLEKMSSAADAYENKAQAQLDIVDSLSDKVSRTSIPLLNRAIMAGKTEIAGDADATMLLNAIQTASAEYAKIMMGGTASAAALTDSAQKEAQKLLNASMSPATLRKATALMRQEMDLTMKGYDAAKQHIRESMGGQAQPAPTPQGPTSGPKVGERRSFGGKIGVWDGKGWKPE